MKVDAVVPAAGKSRRMGTQKLLLPFAGTTVIGHVVRQLIAAPVRSVVAVVSPEGRRVREAAEAAGARAIVNDDPDADMLGSVRCGLRALPADCDAALVAPGDQPAVRPGLVSSMLAALETGRGSVVVPTHAGRRGHPVLIASRWFGEILTHYDDVGLRGLAAAHPDAVTELRVDDEWVLSDIDDPDAYRRALESQPPQ